MGIREKYLDCLGTLLQGELYKRTIKKWQRLGEGGTQTLPVKL